MIYTLTIITITILFLSYSYYIYRRFGVLSSVSASSYSLPKKEQWKFTFVLCFMGIANLGFIDIIGGWAFAASVGIAFAGVTVKHAESPGKVPHTVGTVLAIVATFLGFIIGYGLYGPAIITALGIIAILLLLNKNKIWWIEIWSMIYACIGYIIILN